MKIILSLLGIILFSSIAYTQVDFQGRVVNNRYYYTSNARSVCTADIDGDGDVDVLTASSGDDKIAWYENVDGQGYIDSQNIISTDIDYTNLVVASDIDGDGDLDVIASYDKAYPDEEMIVWFENIDGAGNFSPYNIITDDSHGASSICATDIDGDGDFDILAASSEGYYAEDEVYWCENLDGEGNFGNKNIISTDLYGDVKSADFDGDGDMDVLCASFEKIAWFENIDGEGNFGVQQDLFLYANQDVYTVTTTDLDSDGDIDILASLGASTIAWYENLDGEGNFSSQSFIIYNVPGGVNEINSADIDNDGDIDIIASIEYYEKLVWYENNSGSFEPYQIITTNTTFNTRKIHVADIDNDNDIDVFTVSNSDKVAWYENMDSNGAFGTQQIITKQGHGVNPICMNNIDSDNHIDVVSITFDNKIVWYKNINGVGNFSPLNFISSDAEKATSVHSADIDNDGDIDVLSSSDTDNKISWYENLDGEGTFGLQKIITTNANHAMSVFAIDIDNDGDIDVLSASSGDGKIAWYENINGEGVFSSEQIISTNANGAKSVFATDIDNDGDIDVLSASSGDDKIAWYENINGEGIFGSEQIIPSNTYGASSVYASDIDSDGDIDVISSSHDGYIAWHENIDSEGTFILHQIAYTDATGTKSIHVGDIDGDNDMDIIAISTLGFPYACDVLEWYENIDGNGSFGSSNQIAYSFLDFYASAMAVDIDDDGDVDIISQSDKYIVWYDNLTLSTNQYNTKRFLISPNPTKNTLIIQSKTNISQVEIYNSFGQVVSEIKNNHIINMNDLNEGIYFVRIKDENNNVENHKVIKQ